MVPGLRADVALPGRVEAVVSPRTCVHPPSPCLLCALNWMHTLTLRLPWVPLAGEKLGEPPEHSDNREEGGQPL